MNYKKFGLFVLTIISFGWLGNFYLKETVNDKINKSNYDGKLKFNYSYLSFIKFPLTILMLLVFYSISILGFILLSSVFGYWFVYYFLGMMFLSIFIVPVVIYLTFDDVIQSKIEATDFLPEPESKYDTYFYKRFETE